MDWNHLRTFLEAVISIFAIVNPIGNLPIFIGLTDGLEPPQRRKLLRLAGGAALIIVCVMAMMGRYLLRYVFHIEVTEFMFGGGLILIVVGIRHIVQASRYQTRCPANGEQEQIHLAISPISFPLLVGPGSIVTVMLIAGQHGVVYSVAACLTAFVFVAMVLNGAELLHRIMGNLVALAIGRIMQIFVVAIGVSFLFRAIKQAFPLGTVVIGR